MQERKAGIVDYLYQHLEEKFTSKGAGVPSISWAGCEAAFKWVNDKYGISTSGSNLWEAVREHVGFAWTAVNSQSNGGQGRWHKRFANYLRYKTGVPIDAEALAEVVAPFKVSHAEQVFDFSPINWNAGDFADDNSCYWQGYSDKRKWMVANKFLGCRIYGAKNKGEGRCLIVPTNEGEIGIFNSYGMRLVDFATLIQNFLIEKEVAENPRLVQVILDVRNNGSGAGLYINKEKEGYLITTRDTVEAGSYLRVDFGYVPKECSRCGKEYRGGSSWKLNATAEWALCPDCVAQGYTCPHCGEVVIKGERISVDGVPRLMHPACIERLDTCSKCGGKSIETRDCRIDDKAQSLCRKCVSSIKLWRCQECSIYTDKIVETREGMFCNNCAPSQKMTECEVCHTLSITVKKRADGVAACNHCAWYCEAELPIGRMHKESYSTKTESRHAGFYSFTCPTCREAGRNRL